MSGDVMRQPRQDRSRRTLEKIVDTSIELLREGGWDAVTVGEVERRSGVSRGAFYTRFPTRDALLDHVQVTVMRRVGESQDAALARAEASGHSTLGEAVHAGIGGIAAVFQEHASVLRHADRSGGTNEAGLRAIAELQARFRAIVTGYLVDDEQTERVISFSIRLVFDSLVMQSRRRIPLSAAESELGFEGHVEQLAAAVTAYLSTRAR